MVWTKVQLFAHLQLVRVSQAMIVYRLTVKEISYFIDIIAQLAVPEREKI